MATIQIVDMGYNTAISPDVTRTVAGYIRAPNGAGLRRKVYVFSAYNMTAPLAVTESNSLGAFSVQAMGHPTTELLVLAVGELGENASVYSHTRSFA